PLRHAPARAPIVPRPWVHRASGMHDTRAEAMMPTRAMEKSQTEKRSPAARAASTKYRSPDKSPEKRLLTITEKHLANAHGPFHGATRAFRRGRSAAVQRLT